MMRKFNKKKSGRRGAILVTVVFVLAFATIFIAAAMTLTQATRKRVYSEAYSDQARLTVTSVAEAWYRAVNMCEFDDDSILALCDGSGTTIHVVAPTSGDRIPGMEIDGSTDPNNCTTVFFHRDHTGTGTTADKYTYYADFTTNIGGHTENVRSVLTYTLPATVDGTKPFNAQIDLNTEMGQTNMTDIGKGVNDLDNIFLARHGGKNNNQGLSVYSTMVYCDGAVSFKDDEFYSSDMVFLTGAYFKEKTDSTQPKHMSVTNFFFFGKNDEAISDGNSTHWKGSSGQTFYLCKRSNSGNWSGDANVVYVNANGTKVGDPEGTSSLPADIQAKIIKYASYNTSYSVGGTEAYPTTDQFLKSAKKLGISKTHPSTATKMSLGDFLTTQCYQVKKDFADEGTYYFDSDGSENTKEQHTKLSGMTEDFGDKEGYVIVLDGSKEYKFYFKAGTSFGLRHVVFIVNKPNKSKPVVFVLEEGAKVYWPANGSNDTTSNVRVGGNGIISTTGSSRQFETAEAAYKFVKKQYDNNKSENAPKNFDYENYTDSRGWSSVYNGTNESTAYVIGMGNNTFSIDKCMVIEAFIGLFNKDYGGDNKSTFKTRNSKDNLIYGRIMTDGYEDTTDGGGITMPASPSSSNIDSVDPGFKKCVTNFTLVKMVYYYNLTSNKT